METSHPVPCFALNCFHTIFLVLLQEFIQSMIYFFLLCFVRS